MRISLVVWGMTKLKRGMERVAALLANSMVQRGHRVEILAFDPERRPSVFELHKDVSIYYMDNLIRKDARRETLAHLVNWDADVVVAMFSWFGMLYIPVMLSDSGIPLLISEHNAPDLITHRWNKEERLAAMSGADKIHLLMSSYKDSLPEYMQPRVSVIANPVERATSIATPDRIPLGGKKTLLVVSSFMEESKRISMLVDAFAYLHKDFPDWQVKFFGAGPDEGFVRERIAGRHLEDSFILCGQTDNICEEYRAANLFCLPSKYEGCPCSLQEAQAHGLPAVGFADCPGVNSIILDKENGILVREGTPESLSKALRKLMSNDMLRALFGTASLKNSRKYEPEVIFNQWEKLLAETAAYKGKTELTQTALSGEHARWRDELSRLSRRRDVATPNDPKRGQGPRVSVIVPVYNVERYLDECLDSIGKQTLRDIEIICVNDASPDQCQQILNDYAAKDSRVVLLKHDVNKGLAAARNSGLDIAKGDFIFFIDSDDLFANQDSLERLYLRAIRDNADEVIGGIVKWRPETGERYLDWHAHYLGKEVHGRTLDSLPQLWANVVASNKLVRRALLKENGIRFNERIRKHEDNPFSVQVHIVAKRISIVRAITYVYRQVESGSLMKSMSRGDALYTCYYCQDVFRFIESDNKRHKFREIFYPMYTQHLIKSAELLQGFSPSDSEKAALFQQWTIAVRLLPHDLPNVPERRRTILRHIQDGEFEDAWRKSTSHVQHEEELQVAEELSRKLSSKRDEIQRSFSWRISRPLRECSRLIRGF